MTDQPPTTQQPQSYEEARQRLIEVVQALEAGSVTPSRSLELWQEGEALASACQDWLDGARATIEAATAPAAPDAAEQPPH